MTTTTLTDTVQTETSEAVLTLRSQDQAETRNEYRYSHLLPHFSTDRYPALAPFEHIDPGSRALSHENPRSFLDGATNVAEITPNIGLEVQGVNLADLNSDARDQVALEVRLFIIFGYSANNTTKVARRGLVVFRNQQDFIDRGPEFYRQWGSHFGR